MKRLLLLTAMLLTACASGPRWNWEGEAIKRDDGKYGSWETSNHSNEFSNWTTSIAFGTKAGWLSNQPFIEVQGNPNTAHYVGIDTGDSYICGDTMEVKLAWQDSEGGKSVESLYMRTSENNETLIFSDRAYSAWEKYRFMHQLNAWDKLTVQTDDTCGERTIVRFDIEGTHHVSTTETNSDGYSNRINAMSSLP